MTVLARSISGKFSPSCSLRRGIRPTRATRMHRQLVVKALSDPAQEELEAQMERFMREQAEAERAEGNRRQLDKVLGADVVSEDQARDLCRTVTRVLKTLMEKRDMTVNEVKLILQIEDPRAKEKRAMGIEDESGISRDEIAQAFMDIVGGEVPKDRIALKVLADEMENWPFLDSDGTSPQKLNRGGTMSAPVVPRAPSEAPSSSSSYAEPVVDGWRQGQVRPPIGRDKSERPGSILDTLPDWVGYGTLYVITVIPVIIAVTVIAILFVSSLR